MKIELAHDSLAQKVYDRVSGEEKRIREVERLIKERYAFYQGEPKLTSEEVEYIRPYLKKVNISEEEHEFVEKSWRRQTTQRIRRLLTWAVALLLLLLIVAGGIFTMQTLGHSRELAAKNAEIEAKNQEIELQKEELIQANAILDSINGDLEIATKEAIAQRNLADANAKRAKEEADKAAKAAALAEAEAARAERNAREAEGERQQADSLRLVAERARENANRLRLDAERKARAVNLLVAQQMAEQSLKIKRDDRLKALLARDAYRMYTHFREDSTGKTYAVGYNTQIYQALYAALPDSIRRLNQYTARDSGQAATQIRVLLTANERIYALKGNGQTNRWTWLPASLSLAEESRASVRDQDGIYYALSVQDGAGSEILLSDRGGTASFTSDSKKDEDEPAISNWLAYPWHRNYTISSLADQSDLLITTRDTVFRWNGKMGHIPTPISLLPQTGNWRQVQLHANGEWLAGIDRLGHIHIWRPRMEAVTPVQSFTRQRYTRMLLRPDKLELAAGRQDGVIELINLTEMRTQPKLLRGHEAAVTDLAFNSDYQYLATSSRDRSVQFWPLGEEGFQRSGALKLDQEQEMILSLTFSPDNQALISGGTEGGIRVWPLDMKVWYEMLAKDYPRSQTLALPEAEAFIVPKEDFYLQKIYEALPEYLEVYPPQSEVEG